MTRNLEVIEWKIRHYQELEAQQQAGATESEIAEQQRCLPAGLAFMLERTLQKTTEEEEKSLFN